MSNSQTSSGFIPNLARVLDLMISEYRNDGGLIGSETRLMPLVHVLHIGRSGGDH
jgi:hypothetical protein